LHPQARLLNAITQKTSDVAGNGTMTAVLGLSIYQEGLRNVTAGADPTAAKGGIDKAVTAVVDTLNGFSRRLTSKEEMQQVAAISADNDPAFGKIMAADAFEEVGKDGVITVED
jgi:chaperonin GroEL